jgi:hypothetical protein
VQEKADSWALAQVSKGRIAISPAKSGAFAQRPCRQALPPKPGIAPDDLVAISSA